MVFFNLTGGRRLGHVVYDNNKTVWVSVVFGCNTRRVIIRHKVKHNVKGYRI